MHSFIQLYVISNSHESYKVVFSNVQLIFNQKHVDLYFINFVI